MNKNQKLKADALPFWQRLHWKLIAAFVLLALLPIISVMVITLTQTSKQARNQVTNQLESLVQLKQNQITRWLTDSQAVLKFFVTDPTRLEIFITLAAKPLTNSKAQKSLNDLLENGAKNQHFFKEFFFYTVDGKVIASSDETQIGKSVVNHPYYKSSLKGDVIQSPYYEIGRSELAMFLSHPLKESDQTVGVLAGQLDITILGELMTDRVGLGKSGETYLVNLENNLNPNIDTNCGR